MVPARLRYLASSPAADVLVRLVVVASVVGSGFALWQNHELTECVASYNNANNTRSEILTKANDEERRAERRADAAEGALWLNPSVLKPEKTPADRAELVRLFREYQAALRDQAEERAAADDARRIHPIPDPPSEVCG